MKKIIVNQLKKTYKNRSVVNGINLNIKSGEIVGLLGPNGAGKTTTFYMIVGLIRPNSGNILLDDKDITRLPIEKRAKEGIGYLPQEPSVFRKLSVEQNLLAVIELNKKIPKKDQSAQVDRLLTTFHLNHLRKNQGSSLSGGERRRLEIARVLAGEPDFILLDEPFAGIDPISVTDIKRIIHYLANQGIGVLITDHNVRETLDICHRAYIVKQGHVLCEGNADEIIANQAVRDHYLGETFKL